MSKQGWCGYDPYNTVSAWRERLWLGYWLNHGGLDSAQWRP